MGYKNIPITKVDQPAKDANHPLVQIMAATLCQFNYEEIYKIYDLYNWRLATIESNINDWKDRGWLLGETVRRYDSKKRVWLSDNKWVEVLKAIREEDIVSFQKRSNLGPETRATVAAFVRSLWRFLQGQDFAETLAEANPDKLLILINGSLASYFRELLTGEAYTDFIAALPSKVLSVAFNQNMPLWLRGHNMMSNATLDKLFFCNEHLPDPTRRSMQDNYLYLVEFPRSGCLQEILDRLTPGIEGHQVLTALKHLHEGNAPAAFDIFSKLLKALKRTVFSEPLLNFAYALSIGLTNSAKTQKVANALLKSRECKSSAVCYAMNVVLHHFITHDADKYLKTNPLLNCGNAISLALATAFCIHYSVISSNDRAVETSVKMVTSMQSDYLRLLCLDDFKQLAPIADKLRQQTGLKQGLMPPVRKMEEWERILNTIIASNKPKTGGTKKESEPRMEMERVAYLVNVRHDYSVQPKLQKSKDGGITWSKGRNIAMKSFMSGGEPCMTPQDRKVGSLVHAYTYGWYGGNVSYELEGVKVIAALVGHPAVFNADTEQHIDVVEEPLQLIAQESKGGYKVFSNVDPDDAESGIIVTPVGDKQLTVIRITETQKRTLSLLSTIKVFPATSKQQLTQMLEAVSRDFTVMSPLLKNTEQMKRVEACPLIAVQIAPEGTDYHVSLAVKPFAPHPPYQRPGKGMELVSTTIDKTTVQTERDLKTERKNLDAVRMMMRPFDDEIVDADEWMLSTEQCLHVLELVRTATQSAFVEWPQGVRMRIIRPTIMPDQLRLHIGSAGQWFEVEGEVNIGDKEKLKIAELLQRLREGQGRFIRLNDDEYIALSDQLRRQLEALDKMNTARKGSEVRVATMNGLQLADLEGIGAKVKADDSFRQLISRIDEAAKLQFPIPANIHAELRPYQQTGFTWMSRLAHWGAGACLADDMGLGKTLQAITLMQSRAAAGPQLVIMPTSVTLNWQQELLRFAPALNVQLLNPQGADRKAIVSEAAEGDIILATYGLLVTETELLCSRTWTTIVLDEAHTIKNRDTQTSRGAMQLHADFRLMLTGTPIQNHLSEIWNLFEFANPGLLGTYQQFAERFIIPVERDHDLDRQRLLRRLLSPFLLRRTKEDVLTELPEKTDITLRVQLSTDEQALYDNIRQQAITNLEDGTSSPLRALAEITRLRQAACNARLIDPKLTIPSSKLAAFLELAANLRQSGHRALVFSQFTSHLALIREALDKEKVPYLYLDGATPASTRNSLVRKFQTGDTPLFLISLKAGGLGLNLTAADYVIHLDPWWNPAIEDQASDRAHRIGQERPVTVYRLIAAGTIEEKILRLHGSKRSMADALLAEADIFTQVSAADILHLIREGVEAIG